MMQAQRTSQDYLHYVDPAHPYSFSGAIIGLCGYQWQQGTSTVSISEILKDLEELPVCEVCSVIAHTVASAREVKA